MCIRFFPLVILIIASLLTVGTGNFLKSVSKILYNFTKLLNKNPSLRLSVLASIGFIFGFLLTFLIERFVSKNKIEEKKEEVDEIR